MNDSIEKKLKELLPYIIITGLLFLLLPLFMGNKAGAATYIIQLGAFPLTAAGCSFHFALTKKKHSLPLCFAAPAFYALTALLYGMWRESWYTVLIYIFAYFLCGYLGQALSDIFVKSKGKGNSDKPSSPRKSFHRPRKVDVKKQHEQPAQSFKAEDPAADDTLDTATTDDDIEAILEAIHSRRQQ